MSPLIGQNRVGPRLIVVGLACLPLLVFFVLLAQASSPPQPDPGFSVLENDENGLLLELRVPHFSLVSASVEDAEYLRVVAPGLSLDAAFPGFPQLPMMVKTIGVPPGAEVEISVLEEESRVHRLTRPVLPAAVLEIDGNTVTERRTLISEAYDQDLSFPDSPVSVSSPGYYRDQRVVQLSFNPLRVNAAGNQLIHTQRLLVRVSFVGAVPDRVAIPAAGSPEAERVLASTLLNYEQARAWRGLPDGFQAPQPNMDVGVPVYKIEVDANGIFRVGYADLLEAGMNVTETNPFSFSLSSQGRLVAIELFGDDDEAFEPGDGFLFYGQRFRGTVMEQKYTDVNVYWLTDDGASGLWIDTVDGTLTGTQLITSYRAIVHEEQDLRWNPVRTLDLGDLDTWYWKRSVGSPLGVPVTKTESIELTALASGNHTATIRALLFSECKYYCTGEEHHAQLYFNDILIDEQGQDGSWSNIATRLLSGPVSQTDLVPGLNQLDWVLRSDVVGWSSWGVYLNWFEVEYQRRLVAENNELVFGRESSGHSTFALSGFTTGTIGIWDITFPLTPSRVLSPSIGGDGTFSVSFQVLQPPDAEFIVVGNDRICSPLSVTRYVPPDLDPPGGADWIAIAHSELTTEVERLASHRESQGLRTTIVDVNDIFNQYSHGIYQPTAIRDYLAHALTWQAPMPSYALLVGDGHWNLKRIPDYAPEDPILIPPYLGFLDPYQGEVPADNLYAMLVGTDPLPDIALGRLPAQTVTDTIVLIDKILVHEASLLNPQPWQFNIVFLADEPDSGGDFHYQSDRVAAISPEYFEKVKIYYSAAFTLPIPGTVIDAFNDGATLFNFRGHGSLNYWASDPILFDVSSVYSLTNIDKYPVVVTMDCLDAYFAYPGTEGLSEVLLRHQGGGSVAHWGSSGLGLSADHSVLHEAFYAKVFTDGVTHLGLAVVGAKLEFPATGNEIHNLHTFTLLGDPAMPLMVADLQIEKSVTPAGIFYPGEPVTYTLAYSNHGLYWGNQTVVTDLIPAEVISLTVQWAGSTISPTGGYRHVWSLSPVFPIARGVITIAGIIDPYLDASLPIPITNSATIAGLGTDWVPGNNHSDVPGVIIQPVLSLSKSAKTRVTSGELLTFTLLVTNSGSAVAENGYLVDSLPISTTFQSASGSYDMADGVVTWTLSSLALGEGLSRQLVVQVDPAFVGTLLNVDYWVSADHARTVTGQPVAILAAPPPTASFEVSAHRPALSETVRFTSTSLYYGTPTLSWDFGDGLGTASGPTATYSYTAEGLYDVTLVVSDEFGMDSAQETLDLYQGWMVLEKSAPLTGTLGAPLTYVLSISNAGVIPLLNGLLVDGIPEHSSFLSASGFYTIAGDIVTWTFSLDVGESTNRQLVVQVEPAYSGQVINADYRALADHAAEVVGLPVSTLVAAPPIASFEVSNPTPLVGELVFFTSTSVYSGTPSFSWDFGDGVGVADGATATYVYTAEGEYQVVLDVRDEFGHDSAQMLVRPRESRRIYLPVVVRNTR